MSHGGENQLAFMPMARGDLILEDINKEGNDYGNPDGLRGLRVYQASAKLPFICLCLLSDYTFCRVRNSDSRGGERA